MTRRVRPTIGRAACVVSIPALFLHLVLLGVLLTDARIAEAVVVGKKDPKWGEVPVVFVVRRDGRLTEAEVLANCKADLSSYKRPKDVIFIEPGDLPRSATGKIQRHLLGQRL